MTADTDTEEKCNAYMYENQPCAWRDESNHWGHFSRNGLGIGVYDFGDRCINETEDDEQYQFWQCYQHVCDYHQPCGNRGECVPDPWFLGGDRYTCQNCNPGYFGENCLP
eukprot:UN07380